jgi:hypothetical protein
LAKPILESGIHLEDHDLSSLSALMFFEITECLFRGNIPTLRWEPRHEEREPSIDRYLGLSLPLLPYMYDLCGYSKSLAQGDNPNTPSVMEALDHMEHEVDQ